jgi:hypothetical protein
MMRLIPSVLAFSLATAACGDDTAAPAASDTDASGQSPDGSADTTVPDPRGAEAVCARWLADRADMREGAWTGGSAAACEPGDLDALGRDNTLRQVNLYRWLAGLPEVALDTAKNAAAQSCALIMDANDDIEHEIPEAWRCQEASGVEAALRSNLATAPAVEAIDLYMEDDGIPNLGHRRWILAHDLATIGVGSTSDFSCLHVIDGAGRTDARWTAWPPPGVVPLSALHQRMPWGAYDVDKAGWSIQSDSLDVSRGTVVVTKDGQPVEVTTRVLGRNYGSAYGLAIEPVGFDTRSGRFTVEVTLPREVLFYTFEVVDCGD